MALPLKIKIRSGYLFAFLLLLISYFLIFHIIGKLAQEASSVSHSYAVINKLETIKSEITDAETGVRGYVITKDSRFLEPYKSGSRNAEILYDSLRSIISKNKAEDASDFEPRLDSFGLLIKKRLAALSSGVESFERNGMVVTDSTRAHREENKMIMDRIRVFVKELQAKEYAIMKGRNDKLNGFFNSTKLIAITSLIIAIITIIYSLLVYNRENKEKEKSNAQAQIYSLELEERVNELNRVNIELEELKSIEKFAATGRIARTMAHEVRNPLTNIALASEQIKEIVSESEEAELLLEMIGRNVNRINQLVSDLLHSTRFAQLDFSLADMNEVLDETLILAKDRIDLNGVKVEKFYEKVPCMVLVDREKIKLALLNIIVNGIEAMTKTTGVLQIRTRKQADKCVIDIHDNGAGMDEETIQKLFEPYFTSKMKGNGLGLTNTQNIIFNHKGSITVRSKPEQGSSFIIALNIADPKDITSGENIPQV